MTEAIQHKINVDILSQEMGIEIIDNNDGHLSDGDRIVKRTKNNVKAYRVSSEDLGSSERITKMLNDHNNSQTKISVLFDQQRATSFIAAASDSSVGYLRLYEIEEGQDVEIIADGKGVSFPAAEKRPSSPLGDQIVSGSLVLGGQVDRPIDFYDVSSIGLQKPTEWAQPPGLARSPCDDKSSDAEKLNCYYLLEEIQQLETDAQRLKRDIDVSYAKNLSPFLQRAEDKKRQIRSEVLVRKLNGDIIQSYKDILMEIEGEKKKIEHLQKKLKSAQEDLQSKKAMI